MAAKRFGFILGAILLGATALLAVSAPPLQTTIAHNDTVFNNTNSVTKTVGNHQAKAVSYTYDLAEIFQTNTLTITATRIKTLVDRSSTNAPAVLTWTNTHVIATILTTNNSGSALFTGSIADTFYTQEGDSITYSNDIATNAILTLEWQY
jgi:histidine ammonia-lyase